jgi:hypothetical protein
VRSLIKQLSAGTQSQSLAASETGQVGRNLSRIQERGMTLEIAANKAVVTDGNPYSLYSYPVSAAVKGVLNP